MRLPSLPERERRAVVLGAVVLALGLLFGKGLPAWRRWDAGGRDAAREAVAGAARARVEVRSLPALRDSASARRDRIVALAPRILEGRSAPSGAATLAALVAGAAARAEVQLGSMEMGYDSAHEGSFVPVRVRADASGDVRGLLRMLAILESGPQLLRVPEWALTHPAPSDDPYDEPRPVRLEFAVEGLVAPEREAGR